MTRRKLLPEALDEGAFSIQDALELGVPAGRMRALDLETPFRSLRARVVDWGDIHSICEMYAKVMPVDAAFSHVTAARLYGVPLPRSLEQRESIDVVTRTIQVRAEGVIGHRSDTVKVHWIDGLPVVNPALVWIQLGTILSTKYCVIAGDFLIRREDPLCTVDELAALVADSRGVRGIRSIRHALTRIRPGTDSPMESLLRLLIVDAGLPEPVIGHKIYGSRGDYIGRPDLAYVAPKIAIEYEGERHQADPVRFARDIERRERMQEAGWYVIRVISEHVYERPSWLTARVARVLEERSRVQ